MPSAVSMGQACCYIAAVPKHRLSLLITNVEVRPLAAANVNENVRYEPNEGPPSLVALGAGAQAALITLAPIVLTVVIIVRIAMGPIATYLGLPLRPW